MGRMDHLAGNSGLTRLAAKKARKQAEARERVL
jgi:hypothetical protein